MSRDTIPINTIDDRQNGASRPKRRAPAAPKPPKPMTAAQRNKLATQETVAALGATDEKAAITAVLEAAHERWAWDTELRDRIHVKYKDLEALVIAARPKPKPTVAPMPPLIRPAGLNRQSPLHVLDPYELALDYGKPELRNVLSRATKTNLRVAVNWCRIVILTPSRRMPRPTKA